MPGHEGQIGVRALVADEVRCTLLLQVGVDDAEDAADLVAVTLFAGVDGFGVVEDEPGALAEVGS